MHAATYIYTNTTYIYTAQLTSKDPGGIPRFQRRCFRSGRVLGQKTRDPGKLPSRFRMCVFIFRIYSSDKMCGARLPAAGPKDVVRTHLVTRAYSEYKKRMGDIPNVLQ
jgi:hypothetical protein